MSLKSGGLHCAELGRCGQHPTTTDINAFARHEWILGLNSEINNLKQTQNMRFTK